MLYSYSLCQQEHYNDMIIDLDFFKIQLEIYLKCPYCYIVHDKETDKHIHVLIIGSYLLKKDLLIYFPYADIKILDNVVYPYEYLTHKNNLDKYQYDELDIVYNSCSKDYVYQFEDFVNKSKRKIRLKDFDVLEMITNDIYDGVLLTFKEIFKKYGGIAVKYYRTITDLLERVNYIEIGV